MESCLKTIKDNRLFKKNETIGVGVSGGADSIVLLDFLNKNKDVFDIDVVALHIDHQLREASVEEAAFVKRFCQEKKIRCFVFRADVAAIMRENKMGVEEAAREARYKIFKQVVDKGLADKIAVAHHVSDQAETILLNLFRGSGIRGASGMDAQRGFVVRPFLNTEKAEILNYMYENNLEHVDDESNDDNKFARNFIRNRIMPLVKMQWRGAESNLANFGGLLKEDNLFLNNLAQTDAIWFDTNYAKVPLNYFVQAKSLVSRTVRYALEKLGVAKDYERKHVDLIIELKNAENGAKIDLPNRVRAIKEYDYITIIKQEEKIVVPKPITYKFKTGETKIPAFGQIFVKKTSYFNIGGKSQLIDVNKLPKGAVWRTRQEGDVIAKFGGGTKTLKEYLIEKKVPNRLRDSLPVLAHKNEVYAIATVDISSKVKIDDETIYAYAIDYMKD